MRIGYGSDFHLEFAPISIENYDEIDVLVLAGDICIAEDIKRFPFNENRENTGSVRQEKSARYLQFFREISERFPNVIMVAGNHEYYHGKFNKTHNILKENISGMFPNIHVLQDETVEIGDSIFVGSTLWTDLNHGCPLTGFHVSEKMHDYSCIVYDAFVGGDHLFRKLRTADTLSAFQKSKRYIEVVLQHSRDKNVFVVTHHAPSRKSIHPKYPSQDLLHGAYVSDLSDLMLDNENLKAWFHGHVHEEFNYEIGETRVLCNPRGYPDETQHGYFRIEYIDV